MMRPPDPRFERFLELACDAELGGLPPAEEAELAALGQAYGPRGAEERRMLERAASGLAIAGAGRGAAPLPPHLFARLEQSAPRVENVVPLVAPPAPATRKASRAPLVASWVVAAACILLAVGLAVRKPKEIIVTKTLAVPVSAAPVPSAAAPPSPLDARTALLARAGTETAAWSRTKDPASKEADGDVVWNAALQEGFMRFRGLAANDPKSWQYQLWIFDATGDARYPVDGGVFDVDPATGDVVVPIHAKIAVGKATLFAVTVEKPGGVVVSKRQRIVVTAKLG
jgi:hypothetical protein